MRQHRNLRFLLVCTSMVAACAHQPAKRLAPDATAADIAIRNVTVCDIENRTFAPRQEILIIGDRIAAVGPQPPQPTPARHIIDGTRLVAIPGFVNTHTHLWQHVAKGAAPDKKLQEWASAVYRGSRYLTPSEVRTVVRVAGQEALQSGITTVIDFASVNVASDNLAGVIEGMREAGVDGAVVYWHEAAFAPTEERAGHIRSLQAIAPERIEIWMGYGPLSFFRVPAVYDGIRLANRLHMRMTEHTMENLSEQRDLQQKVALYLDDHGDSLAEQDEMQLRAVLSEGPFSSSDAYLRIVRLAETTAREEAETLSAGEREKLNALGNYSTASPVPLLAYLGGLDRRFVSIHSVWQSANDLAIYRAHDVSVSYNPESNMYLSSGVAPFAAWRDHDLTISLGTDGAASNDAINMFSAMRAAVNLQKVETLNATLSSRITAWDVLATATVSGARVLGQQDRIGSISAGFEADLVLLSLERLGMSPFAPEEPSRAAAVIVNAASPRDVHTVISNGTIRVRDGELTSSEAASAAVLTKIADALSDRVTSGTDWHEVIRFGSSPLAAKYRVVHRADDIDLAYRNDSDAEMHLRVRFSGTLFGGTVPASLAPETLTRFPETAPKKYAEYLLRVPAGEEARLSKKRGANVWSIASGAELFSRDGINAEQIYVTSVRQ